MKGKSVDTIIVSQSFAITLDSKTMSVWKKKKLMGQFESDDSQSQSHSHQVVANSMILMN